MKPGAIRCLKNEPLYSNPQKRDDAFEQIAVGIQKSMAFLADFFYSKCLRAFGENASFGCQETRITVDAGVREPQIFNATIHDC